MNSAPTLWASALVLASLLVVPLVGLNPGETVADRAELISELAEINDLNRVEVRTAQITESVEETYQERPGEGAEWRGRVVDGLTLGRDLALESPVTGPVDREAAARINSEYDDKMSSLSRSESIRRLNKHVELRRAISLDLVSERVRYDDEDLRNLDEMASTFELDHLERMSLTRTQGVIRDATRTVRLLPASIALVLSPDHLHDAEMEGQRLGFIPSWALNGEFVVETCGGEDESGAYVDLVGRESSGEIIRWTVRVRPDLDYRVTTTVLYGPDGEVFERFEASDYRVVDGVPVPFETTTVRSRDGIADYYVKRTSVEEVALNVDLAPDAFNAPEGWRIQDARPTARPDWAGAED